MRSTPTQSLAFTAIATSLLTAGAANGAILYSGPVNSTVNPGQTGSFDLDGDLAADYNFAFLDVVGANSNKPNVSASSGVAFVRTQTDAGLAKSPAGVTVDVTYLDQNSTTGFFDSDFSSGVVGDWDGGGTGHIGLAITAGPDTNFGWAQFTYVDTGTVSASLTLIDFAYETTANQGIVTASVPEPGSLALLVTGAAGVAALRRRRAGN